MDPLHARSEPGRERYGFGRLPDDRDLAKFRSIASRSITARNNRRQAGNRMKWSSFEDRVAEQCKRYARDNKALIFKVDPPSKMVKIAGRNVVIYLENPFLDFHGQYWRDQHDRSDARPIVIEAKTTKGKSLAITTELPIPTAKNPKGKDNGSGLKYAQLQHLRKQADFGALTGVLWESGTEVRWFPKRIIEETIESGRKSLPFDAGIPVPQTPWPDFLEIAITNELLY